MFLFLPLSHFQCRAYEKYFDLQSFGMLAMFATNAWRKAEVCLGSEQVPSLAELDLAPSLLKALVVHSHPHMNSAELVAYFELDYYPCGAVYQKKEKL